MMFDGGNYGDDADCVATLAMSVTVIMTGMFTGAPGSSASTQAVGEEVYADIGPGYRLPGVRVIIGRGVC